MKTTSILVLGSVPQPAEVKDALAQRFQNARIVFCPSPNDLPAADRVPDTDAFVCFLDDRADSRWCLRWLHGVLDEHPYLPVVLVGQVPEPRQWFRALQGARHLRADVEPAALAEAVEQALQGTWWWGTGRFDVPTLIVDQRGRILRANEAAVVRFRVPLVKKFYHQVVERAASAELPADHPIRQTFEEGKSVSRFHEYLAAGDKPRRAFLVCSPLGGMAEPVRAVVVLFLELNLAGQLITRKALRRVYDRIKLVRRYAQRLAAVSEHKQPPAAGPQAAILPHVTDVLLEMYLEVTRADVVYYRECVGETLRLRGEPRWADEPPADRAVPRELYRGDGPGAVVLELVDKNGILKEGVYPEPVFVKDAHAVAERALTQAAPGRFSRQERQFLRWLGSLLYIPVFVQSRLRGVIVAGTQRRNAFSPNLRLELQPIMETTGLWFEAGELRDGQIWWDNILSEVTKVLPKLAAAPTDDAFFAGLATILSAHQGLGWNRVQIFSCHGPMPAAAELVYALGGVGGEMHRQVQRWVMNEYESLESLLDTRLRHPLPGGLDATGVECLDPLYELCVDRPRRTHQPIRIRYGRGVAGDSFAVDPTWGKLATAHPLRWLLEHDDASTPICVPLHLKVEGWLHHMNQRYPGMFCAERAFAFPLSYTSDRTPEPLGLVLVDMTYAPQTRLEEMIPATRVFLELVAKIWTSRYQERFLRGWLGVLPAIRHGRGIKETWDEFSYELTRLLDEWTDGSPVAGNGRKPGSPERAREVRRLTEELGTQIEKYLQVQTDVENFARLSGEADVRSLIPDLGDYVTRLAGYAEELYGGYLKIHKDVAAVAGVSLPCDPLILKEVLHCLVENAVNAARRYEQDGVEVRIAARCDPSQSSNFDRVVVLQISDTGPGIPAAIAPYVFLKGYTFGARPPTVSARRAADRGRGLSIARAQLVAYHGDLQLQDAGGSPDPAHAGRKRGATFLICFGLPSTMPRRPGEAGDEQATASRR